MKQILWKLLMRILFSADRLLKSEVKFTLLKKPFEVLCENIHLSKVEESVHQTTPNFQSLDVALEELIAFESIHNFSLVFDNKDRCLQGKL